MSDWKETHFTSTPRDTRQNFQRGQGNLSPRLSSPLIKTTNETRRPERPREFYNRVAGLAVGISSVFAEHILSHPFVILRRQCQVNHESLRHHITPFTLVPVTYNIISHQSLSPFWKGLSSSLMVKGISVAVESAICELTPLPKEINRHSSLKTIGQHILLKCISYAVASPFYISCLIETVQSDVASETPGVLDVLRDGIYRVIGYNTTNRLLPFWKLVLPCVTFGVLHYSLSSIVQHTVLMSIKHDRQEKDEKHSLVNTYYPELLSNWTSRFLTDLVLYPLELVIHRLGLQGTRTLVDDMDNGTNVIPIVSRYESSVDCFRTIILDEGMSGLYRGIGALMLQYAVHGAVVRVAKLFLVILSRKIDDGDDENQAYRNPNWSIDKRIKEYPVSQREETEQKVHPVNYTVRYAPAGGKIKTVPSE
ncbi:DgyrCDS4436 [Dimorphilus gyrociliatus]|uniref:DgyrCDS4436 n=1 Tax=Dimorphilus gyrociliatus TaxID=2664684 RepID=A0A7I8VIG4_9ANNE|nr:DgyrCDS4436 [Dimorphilus gyrociliatus]